MRILIADDEKGIRLTLRDDLVDAGFEVTAVADGELAWKELSRKPYDLLVSDIVMPAMDGLTLLEKSKTLYPSLFVIMITGNTSDERNRRAIELGANYYIEKPFDNNQIVLLAREAAKKVELERKAQEQTSFQSLVGSSLAMRQVFQTIETIAESEFDVLITGANGTGKEQVARLIHSNSPRADGPMIPVHCGTYAETLIEDELFGHVEGAFTGASGARIGRFERADGGTVFLDDIDDMPLPTQVKLLRVLQEKEVERLGSSEAVPVNVRVVAATKADLAKMVAEGTFREDLYYRLNVIPLRLPSLNQRGGDIPLLVTHFVKKYGGGKEYALDDDCIAALEAYEWPGNVRELENSVKRAIALSGKERILKAAHFLRPVGARPTHGSHTPGDDLRELKEVVEAAESEHIQNILEHTNGAKGDAAKILGISRKNLWEKMKKYGIEDSSTSVRIPPASDVSNDAS